MWESAIYELDRRDRPIELLEYGVAHVRLLESVWTADSSKVFGRHLTNDVIVGLNAIHVWGTSDGRHLGHLVGGGSTSTLYKNRAGLAL